MYEVFIRYRRKVRIIIKITLRQKLLHVQMISELNEIKMALKQNKTGFGSFFLFPANVEITRTVRNNIKSVRTNIY